MPVMPSDATAFNLKRKRVGVPYSRIRMSVCRRPSIPTNKNARHSHVTLTTIARIEKSPRRALTALQAFFFEMTVDVKKLGTRDTFA